MEPAYFPHPNVVRAYKCQETFKKTMNVTQKSLAPACDHQIRSDQFIKVQDTQAYLLEISPFQSVPQPPLNFPSTILNVHRIPSLYLTSLSSVMPPPQG